MASLSLSFLHGAGKLALKLPRDHSIRPAGSTSLPVLGACKPGRVPPRRDTAPPRGPASGRCAVRHAQERAQLARPGWPGCPRGEGSAQRGPACCARPGGSKRWALGREGAPGARGARSRGVRGWRGVARLLPADVSEPQLCLPACLSVCAPGQRGRCGTRGSAPCSPAAAGARGSDRDAATWVFLVRPLAGSGAALASGTARGSRARSPRRCRCLFRGRRLQVPSPSAPHARSLAAWRAPGQRGRAGGRGGGGAAAAEEGVSSLGMGKAWRGSGRADGPTLQTAPEPGTLAVRLACCHLARLGPVCKPRRECDCRGP